MAAVAGFGLPLTGPVNVRVAQHCRGRDLESISPFFRCWLTPEFCCGGLSHVTLAMVASQYLMLGAQPNDSSVRPRLQQLVVRQRSTIPRKAEPMPGHTWAGGTPLPSAVLQCEPLGRASHRVRLRRPVWRAGPGASLLAVVAGMLSSRPTSWPYRRPHAGP